MNSSVSVLIDWLTFTSRKFENPRDLIREYLHIDPDLFFEQPYGLLFYSKCLDFCGIKVCYDPLEGTDMYDMGICVSMSGSACREFECYYDFEHLFADLVQDETIHFSRIDIACDDKSEILDFDDMIDASFSGRLNSRIKNRSLVVSSEGSGVFARTLYIGSEKSDLRFRIYDKAAQLGQSDPWLRFEVVLKGSYSECFPFYLESFACIGDLVSTLISQKLRFIDRDDGNISRCSSKPYWLAFLSNLYSVHLSFAPERVHCLERISDWVEFQMAPTLSMLYDVFGISHLINLCIAGRDRRSSVQDALVSDFFRCDLNE